MTNVASIQELSEKKNAILEIHEVLSSALDLKPCEQTNSAFSRLVSIVRETSSDDSARILADDDVGRIAEDLRKLASRGESGLELYWVRGALESSDPERFIKKFPYYANYEKMTELEMETMRLDASGDGYKALFVGSGPLPLSSIMMARACEVSIDNLDMDPEACTISQEFIARLGSGLSEKITVINADILNMRDFSKYDMIFIAALVGENEREKAMIIDHIVSNARKDCHIAMRSVSGLGKLLYPEITDAHLQDIEVIARSESPKDIINNIIIGKIKSKQKTMNHAQSPEAKEKLAKLMRQYEEYKSASSEIEKERIGNEMTYADPVVWMMYKHYAYRGSDHDISTLGGMREHSAGHGGICAKRFDFLAATIKKKFGKNIRNSAEFADEMALADFYESELMDSVVLDEDFMRAWNEYEFYKKEGKVAKWQNYELA